MNKYRFLLFISFFYLLLTKETFAYLDPGSASLFFQAIVGGILAGITGITFYWNKIKNWSKRQYEQIKNKKS
jgi:hypothetical protein